MAQADPVTGALELAGALYRAATALHGTDGTVDRLRTELARGDTRLALLLLHNLPTDDTVALAGDVVPYALSARDTLLVRHIFGRLPRHEAEGVVPAAVRAQLAKTPDGDAYRSLLGLLDHLGLDAALREIAETALASDDPDVRDAGEEYLGD